MDVGWSAVEVLSTGGEFWEVLIESSESLIFWPLAGVS